MLHHLLTALLMFTPPAAVFSQAAAGGAKAAGGEGPCRAIRRLGHPFGKRPDLFREVRYALLDTCPDRREMVARPMMQVTVGGEKRFVEFEVVRFFEDRQEAERHARANGVADFKTEAEDYLVLPQTRPVVHYFKALKTGDFELYRAAFDYDRKPRRLDSPDFWADLRRRHAERLRKRFGLYSPDELDFRFVPLNRSKRAGRIDVIHRGRTFGDLMRVVFVEEAGGWKIDVMRW